MQKKNLILRLVLATVLISMLFVSVPMVAADAGTDSTALRNAVTLANIRAHQQEFQNIADANDGTRAAGSPGHAASADYVEEQLEEAGYTVSRQSFQFPFFQEIADPVLEQISPNPTVYVENTDFATMEYSASGDVTAQIQAVDLVLPPGPTDNTSNSGCEASDFAGFTPGNIALMQRGTCPFAVKAANAQTAGAVGAIIFNEGQPGRTAVVFGTLGGPGVAIPVVGMSFALGNELNTLLQSGPVTIHMLTSTLSEIRTTENVIAETAGGRTDRVVVVGAHLDSVPEGPGINDNGSGSAAILEIALQMAELGITPQNQVRFIWFSAEEQVLLGSIHYVNQLTKRDIKNISVMLNFDMVGSPNFVRFVYDGDGSDTGVAGPNGSRVVEDVFLDYFASQNLPNEPTPFSGRSDYGPFIGVGIPAGGLFTGAEGLKTPEQVAVYGGIAEEQYDPCYHLSCDTYTNNSNDALDQMSDAAAHAVLTFAMTTSAVNGTDRGTSNGTPDMEYLGSKLQK